MSGFWLSVCTIRVSYRYNETYYYFSVTVWQRQTSLVC